MSHLYASCLSIELSVCLSVSQFMCLFFCKQYAYLSVSLSVRVSVSARVCRDKRMRKMIVLLDPRSRLRLGGDSPGCRGQRLCGSGLLASGGVLELPHQTKRTPSSVYCTRLHEKALTQEGHTLKHTRTHSLERQHRALGEFS